MGDQKKDVTRRVFSSPKSSKETLKIAISQTHLNVISLGGRSDGVDSSFSSFGITTA